MEIGQVIQSKFRNSKHKAVVNLRYTANCLGNIQNSYMAKFDLSMPQFNILRILRGAQDVISVNAVKSRMVEKSPNTTRLMDKLIDKGLMERVRCESDRRVVYVSITEAGLNALKQIDEDDQSKLDFAGNLTETEAEALSDLLDKLRG
ncbi:MarR family transcriptional regulator [Fluviicola sp.]|jgi:DNA-binding MarR family transcriptional regulator|uniref:MarR family winged helix-turn-helix transcriptional regulator n=1 Tax=Fluviicola sp. TaxID=1917219 RepID=UPI00282FB2EB|nr:MarR family transcriptional regulator [Fluviicola sp.]MDR0802589.1 MarR family transcriptional regulator [Fluviicola sp.]